MKIVKMTTGWVPQNLHGSLPYSKDQDVASVVQQGINNLLLQRFRINPTEIRYIIETQSNGKLMLTFEVIA